MRHMKKRTIVPLPRDEMFLEKITCDFCGSHIDHMQRYEEDAVTIEHREGFNSPEGVPEKFEEWTCVETVFTVRSSNG